MRQPRSCRSTSNTSKRPSSRRSWRRTSPYRLNTGMPSRVGVVGRFDHVVRLSPRRPCWGRRRPSAGAWQGRERVERMHQRACVTEAGGREGDASARQRAAQRGILQQAVGARADVGCAMAAVTPSCVAVARSQRNGDPAGVRGRVRAATAAQRRRSRSAVLAPRSPRARPYLVVVTAGGAPPALCLAGTRASRTRPSSPCMGIRLRCGA